MVLWGSQEVTEGQWKWYRSIYHIQLPITFYCNYVHIMYHFWDIQHCNHTDVENQQFYLLHLHLAKPLEFYQMLWQQRTSYHVAFIVWFLHLFWQNTSLWWTDRWTDSWSWP